MKCPVCKTVNYVKYVFVEHYDYGKIRETNPTDMHFIFMCENLHFFDYDSVKIEKK